VRLGPVETFAPATPVVKLGVTGDGFAQLCELRDSVFVEPLKRPLTWPFVPHVTLADDVSKDRIPAALTALSDFETEVTFDAVHILREGEGRKWHAIADSRFRPSSVVGRGSLPTELTVSELVDPVAAELLDSPVEPTTLAVTARREGITVGIIAGSARGQELAINCLTVRTDDRSQGVGRALLAAFCHEAVTQDFRQVVTDQLSDECLAFLHSQGFVNGIRQLAQAS